MRNSILPKWTKNNKMANGKKEKEWIHAPEKLLQGHVVYLVKVRKRNPLAAHFIFCPSKLGTGMYVASWYIFNIILIFVCLF